MEQMTNPENTNGIETKVDEMVKDGIKEINIRYGKSLEVSNPVNVEIEGTISAPSIFIKARNDDFKKNELHALICRSKKSIVLNCKEQSPFGAYKIKGFIKISDKFESLGINKECVSYTPEALSKKLNMLRSLFEKKADHLKIVGTLRNIRANVNKAIEKDDDKRGNLNNIFKQTVESNVPETFSICVPLLEGEKPKTFEVSIILEAGSGNDIHCYLESIDAADMIEAEINEIFDQEAKILEEYCVVIES